MELFVWEGEPKWGLPSMDIKSLQMVLYIKFSEAPVTITNCSHPFSAPKCTLPAFRCSDGILTDFHTFCSFLRHKGYNCDHSLSARQCSDVRAYQSLLEEKLMPALTYLWWVEPSNYHSVIHKWYYNHMGIPFKFWLPRSYHNKATQLIHSLVEDEEDNIEAIETTVIKSALECLTMLSYKIGEREFFFGEKPCAIDAILLPYLALLLKVDLKLPVLQNYIKSCANLSRYVLKSFQRVFPEDKTDDPSSKSKNPEDVPNKGRNLLLSTVVAGMAMLGYAVATGLVQVEMGDKSAIEDDADDYGDIFISEET